MCAQIPELSASWRGGASREPRGGPPDWTQPEPVFDGPFKSKDSLCAVVESYIGKVSSAGQLTLPKRIRKALGLKGSEYVEVALLGKAVVIRRLREEDELLDTLRRKVKKSGLTRARVRELVDEAGRKAWKKRYGQAAR